MPELPEVEALSAYLTGQAAGRVVRRVEQASLSALKTYAPPLDALAGRTVNGFDRRGKYLVMDTGGLFLAVHLSRSGWVRWSDNLNPKPVRPGKGPLALRVRFDGEAGFDVTEAATEKRVAIHVVTDLADVDGIAKLGPDPLDPSFDAAALGTILAGRRMQVKGALTDQSLIAGVGNAYSDEALHVAKLSPFKMSSSLTEEEVARLHSALVGVLREAVERSDGLAAKDLKDDKRSGMRVHGRAGQPCPECGDTVREVSFATSALQYCATCQTGGKPLADRRLSKLLK